MRERLRALTTEQYQRLIKRSQYLVRYQRILAADLRQEALLRALDGRRKCRQSWDIVAFLNGVMRSMIRDDCRDEAEGRTLVLHDDLDGAASDNAPFPFEKLANDALDYRRTIASIGQALSSDPQLMALVDAISSGKRGEELQRQLHVDERGLAALRRRLKRKLDRVSKGKSRP